MNTTATASSPKVETTAQSPGPQAAPAAAARVLSVDALRGFDMLWIIGAGSLVQALNRMSSNPVTNFFSTQLQHAQWVGFRFYDLIFPLFLFIIGVSLVFSLDKAIESVGKGAAFHRIVRRSLLLFALGVFHSGGLTDKWPGIAFGGVLHRIAACYLFAALIYLFCGTRWKLLTGIATALLVSYWALVTFVPFPDLVLNRENVSALAKQTGSDSPFAIAAAVKERASGVYEEGRNLTNFLDFLFLPGKKAQLYYINEGLLSTLPAIAICLFGALAGRLLKDGRVEPGRKVQWLLVTGIALLVLGWLWSFQFPLIKRIWTSSFCLVASGCAALLLAAFYFVVDVRQWRKWCQPFVWIGMNSITVYLAVNIVSFPELAERLAGGDVKAFLDANVAKGFGQLTIALAGLALAVLLCWFLHRKKIFLRV